jgi:endonuclease/exonuclease/phosphatase family metal-dependent hydrolase
VAVDDIHAGADLVGLQESLTPMLRLSRPRWNHQHCFAGQHGLAHDRTHAIKPSTLLVGNEFDDPHDRFDAVVDLDRAFEE